MPFHRLSVLLVTLLSVVAAQTDDPTADKKRTAAAAEEKVATASISGRVTSAATGSPLKKAWVVLRQGEERGPRARGQSLAAMTKEDGTYQITGIPAGSYRLSVNRNGYVAQTYGQRGSRRQGGATLTIITGQEMKDVNFRLVQGGVITGRVLDEDGEPLAGVQVSVMRNMYVDGERRLQPLNGARTDDRGEYRIHGLEPRAYHLMASVRSGWGGMGGWEGPIRGEAAPDERYATTYYGGGDRDSASSIEVRGGEEARADFVMFPARTFRVSGRALDGTTGEPAAEGMVMLIGRSSPEWMPSGVSPISGKDGRFEIRGVAAGSYTLMARTHREDPLGAAQEIEVGEANIENVNLTLVGGREIEGALRIEGSSADLKLADLNVNLMAAGGRMMMAGFAQGSVKADGSFTLKNVFAEDYTVAVQGLPPTAYVKSIRSGQEELLYTGLSAAKARGPIEIVISTKAPLVEGTVTGSDGKPFQGATVVAVPEKPVRSRWGNARAAATDQYGKFSFKGLRPGEYKLYAWEDADESDYQDPAFLKKFTDHATTVRLSEGQTGAADLRLIPGGVETAAAGN